MTSKMTQMFTAMTSAGKQISAEDAAILGGDYFCPKCSASVLLRNGLVKVEHFAHAAASSCDYAGESPLHLQMKYQIFQKLKLFWDMNNFDEQGFIAFKVDNSYTEGVDFYDRDRGEQVSYSPKMLKTIKVIKKVKRNLQITDLTIKDINFFPMPHASYDLPARKLVYYEWPREKGLKSK